MYKLCIDCMKQTNIENYCLCLCRTYGKKHVQGSSKITFCKAWVWKFDLQLKIIRLL